MGEDEGAGRIVVIRGGRDGYARTGHSEFDQNSRLVPGVAAPDREFGSTLSVLQLTRDRRPDVALAAGGEDSADERVMVVRGGRRRVRARRDAHHDAAGRGLAGARAAGRADPPGADSGELSPTFV